MGEQQNEQRKQDEAQRKGQGKIAKHSMQRTQDKDGRTAFLVGRGTGDEFEPLVTFPTEGEAKLQVDHLDRQAEEDAKTEKDKAERRQQQEPRGQRATDPEADPAQGAGAAQGRHHPRQAEKDEEDAKNQRRAATAKHKTATRRSVPKHKARKHK